MKKFSFCILLFSMLTVIFFSCEKKKEPELCTLYGVVTDKATGEPIRAAGVELLPVGKKSVTGSDGAFEFIELEEGIYKLYINKSGYKDYTSNDVVVKAGSEKVSHSIQLEKLPPALTIVDDNQNEIDSIDFGSDEGTKMRSFNIFNNGEDKLEWSIVYQCEWIKAFSKIEGELKANATQSIVITIDRMKLNVGDNSTIIHIVSNNGSKQLKVSAKCVSVVETKGATDIGGIRAVLNAYVVRDLNPSITEYGFVYSTSPAPRLTNGAQKVSQVGTPKIGTYSMLVEGLENNTQYYACAYVSNSSETIYGEQTEFTTTSHIPAFLNIDTTQVRATSISLVYEMSDGGLPLEEVGICWSTAPVPTIEDNYKKTGSEAKQYKTTITELEINTLYYIRAYARNSESESYSTQIAISTTDGLPSVKTHNASPTSITSITVSGEIIDNGGFAISERGFCYSSTNAEPTLSELKTMSGSGSGLFNASINDLDVATKYYVRAYATNSIGTAYGQALPVTTNNGVATIKLEGISDTTATTASASVKILTNGGAPIQRCGVCWSTQANPTINDYIIIANGNLLNTNYICNLSDLKPDTKYFVRGFVTTSVTTSYSDESCEFTTNNGLPIVKTIDPEENITKNSIVAVGNVIDDGGAEIIERGVVYSTLPYPTLENSSNVSGGKGLGYFSVTITGIAPLQNTYYIRAYAKNVYGISYGDQIAITQEQAEYASLRTMTYSGYTYKIKFIGSFAWSAGKSACNNLEFGGHDDWFMPNIGEVQKILETYNVWNITSTSKSILMVSGCDQIWTNKEANTGYAYMYYIDHWSEWNNSIITDKYQWKLKDSVWSADKSEIKGVFAVRKYNTSSK